MWEEAQKPYRILTSTCTEGTQGTQDTQDWDQQEKKKVQVRRRDQSGQGQVAFGVLGDSTPFPQNANLTGTNHHFPKHLPKARYSS